MELQLKLSAKNNYPLGGLLIKSEYVSVWIREIAMMGLPLPRVDVYPIPGSAANSVWGCLITTRDVQMITDIRQHNYCQLVAGILFIPERARLSPAVSEEEIHSLFKGKKHLFHPEIGLVELEEKINWENLLSVPESKELNIREASASVFIPANIRSFQVKPQSADAALEQLEEQSFPKKEKLPGEPLTLIEKLKLSIYRRLFKKEPASEGNAKPGVEKTALMKTLDKLRNIFGKKPGEWAKKLETNYEELEKRNQKHLDRLIELLKDNPEKALRYAIPLDGDGTTRGSGYGEFNMENRWRDFSLFGNSPRGSGGVITDDDGFIKLRQQYTETANELVKQGNHIKAAFIYMKLLKDYHSAARVLEEGRHYAEAASIYLKYLKNKHKAAECFEKANMISNSIELYKEFDEFEKVGDLYFKINKQEEGLVYYGKLAERYRGMNQFLKCSLVYREKMNNMERAQNALMKGWKMNRDAFNCLNNYLNNIDDPKERWIEIDTVAKRDVQLNNCETFLRVLQYEFQKEDELSGRIRDLSYEIITQYVEQLPSLVSALKEFNKADKQLMKDTLRFKVGLRK